MLRVSCPLSPQTRSSARWSSASTPSTLSSSSPSVYHLLQHRLHHCARRSSSSLLALRQPPAPSPPCPTAWPRTPRCRRSWSRRWTRWWRPLTARSTRRASGRCPTWRRALRKPWGFSLRFSEPIGPVSKTGRRTDSSFPKVGQHQVIVRNQVPTKEWT